MAAPVLSGDDRPSRWGYLGAIVVSAAGHAALFILVLFILPRLFRSSAPPPAYTVKIVDSLPAGDLGTHLPRLSQDQAETHPKREARREPPEEHAKPKPTPPPPENDKNAIALNSLHMTPTPTPPAPTPTPAPAPTPHPRHHHKPTPVATPTPPPRHVERHKPKPRPTRVLAKAKPTPKPERTPKAEPTPDVKQELARVREKLLAEHLKEIKAKAEAEKNAKSPNAGGGPVLASAETSGKGMGVGPGSGSAGIQQDPEFLLYYQQVQKKIKEAWSFAGNNPKLTTTVTFGINPDGTLNSVKVVDGSRDLSFDDSVVRAIRRAAPFAPPPQKYRDQFSQGVEAVFELGELSS